MTTPNLRDELLASLLTLPGKRTLHLHVLVSSPRKHPDLFPYAASPWPKHRIFIQDIAVLLSEASHEPDAPRAFVTGIEAALYTIPSTSSCILYISKVDSTGQGHRRSPTRALVQAFIRFHLTPSNFTTFHVTQLWLHVFARAQGQYLFPHSSQYAGKRVLSDVRLCAWWKSLISGVANAAVARIPDANVPRSESAPESQNNAEWRREQVKLYYLLPGYTEFEANQTLSLHDRPSHPSASTSHDLSVPWKYGHPYSQAEILLPFASVPYQKLLLHKQQLLPSEEEPVGRDGSSASQTEDGTKTTLPPYNLGQIVPSFDDDPKSRFIDELACATEYESVKSPPKKRTRGGTVTETLDETKQHPRKLFDGELGSVSADEFWERMGFRQECVTGALTGFFVGVFRYAGVDGSSKNATSPPPPHGGFVPHLIVKRVISSLLTGHVFTTRENATRATEIIERLIGALCDTKPEGDGANGDGGVEALIPFPSSSLRPPRTPPRRTRVLEEVTPNPFPEPEMSMEMYRRWVYGSIDVDNADDDAGCENKVQEVVTVLAVRKKRKR